MLNNSEKKQWILKNFSSLASRGKLPEALNRYFKSVAEEKKNKKTVVDRAIDIFIDKSSTIDNTIE